MATTAATVAGRTAVKRRSPSPARAGSPRGAAGHDRGFELDAPQGRTATRAPRSGGPSRATSQRGASAARPAASPHRRSVERSAAPKSHRRVSGPARPAPQGAEPPRASEPRASTSRAAAPRAAAPRTAGARVGALAMSAAGIALNPPLVRPSRPARPATRPARPASRPARPVRERTSNPARAALGHVYGAVRAIPDIRIIDRFISGRAWIAVLGVMLAGIVFLQVEVLRYGATIGRAIEQTTALQSRNEVLRASVAQLGNVQRIEQLAEHQDMVMPAPAGVGFVAHASVARAIANITAPNAATFGALHTTNGGLTTSAGKTAAIIPPSDQG